MKRLILFVLAWFALFGPNSAFALSPPVGWTAAGEHRAVLDVAHPEKGEILEFQLRNTKGLPEEIVAALLKKGIAIERFSIEPNGHINLVGPERLGRARLDLSKSGVATWWAVLASKNEVAKLDPDAILLALVPSPAGVNWGAKEVLGAGGDGTPWGEVDALNDPKTGGWGTKGSQSPWIQDAGIIGQWECSVALRGVNTRLRFYFENNGGLRVQAMVKEKERVTEGKWASRDGLMRMDIDDGGANLPYMVTDQTLSVPYAGARLILYRQ
jgi:hypothetical protein